MSNIKKIAKVGVLYMIGTLFYRGIAFLMVPIYTRVMGKADYGILNTYTAWVSALTIIVSLTLYMGVRAAFIDYEEDAATVLSSVITFTLIYGAFLLAIAAAVLSIFDINVDPRMVICCLLQSLYAAILNDYMMYLMMKKQYKQRLLFMVLPEVVVNTVAVIAVVYFYQDEKYMGRIIPGTMAYMVFAMIMVLLVYRKSRANLNKEYLKFCLGVSLPLVLHGLSQYVLNQSDRVMITWLRDASETAVYSVIYNIGMLSTAVSYALEGVWVPWFTDNLKAGKRDEINVYAKKYTQFMTLIMCGIVMVSPEIIKIMSPKSYWEGMSIVPPIVFSNFFIFVYTLYVNIEHFHKKTRFIAVNTLTAAVVNLVLNYLLIPKFGYVAAAYTTLVSYFVSLVMHAAYAKRLEKNLYPIRQFGLFIVEVLAVVPVYYTFLNSLILRWTFALGLVALNCYTERAFLKQALAAFRKKKGNADND